MIYTALVLLGFDMAAFLPSWPLITYLHRSVQFESPGCDQPRRQLAEGVLSLLEGSWSLGV